MHDFQYKNNTLYCEDLPVATVAEAVGTPFYLYSAATLTRHFTAFDRAFASIPHLTCFAVKSCANIAILRLFANLGGGADIVSEGELFRARAAGIDPQKIVYSGVGKTAVEIRAALKAGILMLNVESEQELAVIQTEAAALGLKAPVSFRVNPDVDPRTHAYISTGLAKNKFGIPIGDALRVYLAAQKLPNITIKGVSCHIGSQLIQVSPFVESLVKLKSFIAQLAEQGIAITHLDLGGGLGIRYNDEEPPEPDEYARAIKMELADLDCTLILEPGRVLVGNAGVLITKVLYTKEGLKKFIIVDAGMNDLARPSLYNAFHLIQAVERQDQEQTVADVVGPICETGDFLARERLLPQVTAGDLLAVMSAGAYGFSMSSNYNSRPRVAEVLVHGDGFHLIRARETKESLIQGESIPEFLGKHGA
ncbi:MAG: diaminopimelate decarboxylase [Deltaproteobacteria bacterium RIFOXYD12_FULL_55_16]|nr:MAG: diaminopimelate decarboxylase [Deltaproteobacteria bacterium RIFOXYD12_FULL_55_16]